MLQQAKEMNLDDPEEAIASWNAAKADCMVVPMHPSNLMQFRTYLPCPMPPSILMGFAVDLLRAIEHLDKYNVVHCDLKLDNILVARDGRLVLCDFGLSRMTNAAMEWEYQDVRPKPTLGSDAPVPFDSSVSGFCGGQQVCPSPGRPEAGSTM